MTEPIFIVGAPRSGTTLLSAMLAAHSALSCGPETHFFRRLAAVDADLLCDPQAWPGPAVDFICSIRHSGYGGQDSTTLLEKYGITREEVASYLESREPSIAAILASVTVPYMAGMGKQRWVEKTPDHLAFTPLIRRYFPRSPIIRIVRDSRDVALSLLKVPWGAQSFLEALLFWKKQDDRSRLFFAGDENTHTLRFEDLIASPVETLETLCDFVGVAFEPGMLDTARTGKQVNSRSVSWKAKASQPLDASRIASWRNALTPAENQLAEAILGDRLAAYGYPIEARFRRLGEIIPDLDLAIKYESALTSVASEGVRFWQADDGEKPSVRVYLGDPGNNRWLKDRRSGKLAGTLSISANILSTPLTGKSVYWIPESDEDHWSGYSAFLLKKLLALHRHRTTTDENA